MDTQAASVSCLLWVWACKLLCGTTYNFCGITMKGTARSYFHFLIAFWYSYFNLLDMGRVFWVKICEGGDRHNFNKNTPFRVQFSHPLLKSNLVPLLVHCPTTLPSSFFTFRSQVISYQMSEFCSRRTILYYPMLWVTSRCLCFSSLYF